MPETLPSTGDAALDFALEAGPRALTPDLPHEVRFEIGKLDPAGPYMCAVRAFSQDRIAHLHHLIDLVSAENRRIEATEEFKASNGLGYPWYRKPVELHYLFEAEYGIGCWEDENFVEDVLKHHPGLRINVRRGTRGQEYVNGSGR
jgi:hypothetical protein